MTVKEEFDVALSHFKTEEQKVRVLTIRLQELEKLFFQIQPWFREQYYKDIINLTKGIKD